MEINIYNDFIWDLLFKFIKISKFNFWKQFSILIKQKDNLKQFEFKEQNKILETWDLQNLENINQDIFSKKEIKYILENELNQTFYKKDDKDFKIEIPLKTETFLKPVWERKHKNDFFYNEIY